MVLDAIAKSFSPPLFHLYSQLKIKKALIAQGFYKSRLCYFRHRFTKRCKQKDTVKLTAAPIAARKAILITSSPM
jgi:hypothetical protein